MPTFRFKVETTEANETVRVINVGWRENKSVCDMPSAFEALSVSFGDGNSQVILAPDQRTLTRNDNWAVSSGGVDFKLCSQRITHKYAVKGSYTCTVTYEGICPILCWRACPVTEVLDPLPGMYAEDGSLEVNPAWTFYESNLAAFPDDLLKNWSYVRAMMENFHSCKMTSVPSTFWNPIQTLDFGNGVMYGCTKLNCDMEIRGKNWTRVYAFFQGCTMLNGRTLYAEYNTDTYETFKDNEASSRGGMLLAEFPSHGLEGSGEGFFFKDGRRFESVFYATRAGTQNFDMICSDGMDLGAKFAAGTSDTETNYQYKGTDIGKLLLGDPEISYKVRWYNRKGYYYGETRTLRLDSYLYHESLYFDVSNGSGDFEFMGWGGIGCSFDEHVGGGSMTVKDGVSSFYFYICRLFPQHVGTVYFWMSVMDKVTGRQYRLLAPVTVTP